MASLKVPESPHRGWDDTLPVAPICRPKAQPVALASLVRIGQEAEQERKAETALVLPAPAPIKHHSRSGDAAIVNKHGQYCLF